MEETVGGFQLILKGGQTSGALKSLTCEHEGVGLSLYLLVCQALSVLILQEYRITLFVCFLYFSFIKGQVQPQNEKYICFLFPDALNIHQGCFGVSCKLSEISAVEISAFYCR